MLWYVPHHHVVLQQGYTVWTYMHASIGPRQVRHLLDRLVRDGHKPIILTCHRTTCRIYGDQSYVQSRVEHCIDRERSIHLTYQVDPPAP